MAFREKSAGAIGFRLKEYRIRYAASNPEFMTQIWAYLFCFLLMRRRNSDDLRKAERRGETCARARRIALTTPVHGSLGEGKKGPSHVCV